MPVNSISTNGTKAASWESNGNEPHHIGGEVPLERETTGNSGGFFGTALFKAIAAGGVVLVSNREQFIFQECIMQGSGTLTVSLVATGSGCFWNYQSKSEVAPNYQIKHHSTAEADRQHFRELYH